MESVEEIEQIKKLIEAVDVVSFDIFDTLLLRNVMHPTDIFNIVEIKYYENTAKKVEFKKKRILAEQRAREISSNEDVTYEEIYKQLENMLPNDAKVLKKIELQTEEEFLIANNKLVEVYNFAIEQGKKVLMISDMYLLPEVLNKWLKEKGYNKGYSLYVSSEVMYSKATGTLYEYIRSKEEIQGNNWLHIGDNYHSDYVNANKANIKGYHYQAVRDRFEVYKYENLTGSIIRAIQINTMYLEDTYKDYWYNFGIYTVAPLYIGFMSWLEKELEGKDNIYFLARDGYMPYQLYQKLCETNDKLPKGKYLYASRRAYIYPNLPNMKREEALDILMAANKDLDQHITAAEILGNIGLEYEKYESILSAKGIQDVHALLDDKVQIYAMRDFLEEIWSDIEKVLNKEYVLLKQYFKQEGLYDYKEVNIVDIGWRGSTHRALQQVLDKKVNGYYLGTIKPIYKEIKNQSKGYLFNEGNPRKKRRLVMENVMIFELLFSAPMGSVIRFRENNKITAETSKLEKNDILYANIVKMQQAIVDIYEKINRYSDIMQKLERESIEGLGVIEKFIQEKNILDLQMFKEMTNVIGLGKSKDIKEYVRVVQSEEYLKNIKNTIISGKYLLWKDALLIQDKQGRFFNVKEFNVLYRIKKVKDFSKFQKWGGMIKKAVLNPRKAIKYIYKNVLIK